jgi:transposase-like protein
MLEAIQLGQGVTHGAPVLIPARVRKKSKRAYRLTAAARTLSEDDVPLLTESESHSILCRLRWPETRGNPVCPRCKCHRYYTISTRNIWKCAQCKLQFSVTSGTALHSRKLSFNAILRLFVRFALSPDGVSSCDITNQKGFDYKTSWVFNQKIREALGDFQSGLILQGNVEIDGVYFGGSRRKPNRGRGDPKNWSAKTAEKCILTFAQRGGPVVAVVTGAETKLAIIAACLKHVRAGSTVITDELGSYDCLWAYYEMRRINHSVEFANGLVSVNNAESFHARMRRAEAKVYRRFATGRYFDKYAAELAYRHGCREVDNRTMWERLISMTIQQPRSKELNGYWQRHRRK